MLADTVASAIREAISDGEFQPGQQLSEVRAAQRFSCSRNTLRESFAMLSAQQLIHREPYRGVFIATPDAAYVRDLYLARAALEPAGVAWGTFANPQALVELAQSARAFAAAGQPQQVSNINQRFHRALVAAAGSASLDREMSHLLARMRLTFLLLIPRYPDIHTDHIESNVRLAQLIAQDKRADAADYCRACLLQTLDKITGLLEG
ncbi:GntR family transcriptional regulator [Corynebacterium lizhenjunii]|uniref:GntR family transcriptional regulator n=1 Tax=Corynebacterium lizhenjunii TaxID=2709394 RepID=UPI0013EC0D8F|nr:GntR family transcriptional regulator [Corynebacterium lizhenjunii]